MIDEVRIREMRETFGDAEFIELIGLFQEEAEEIVADLRDRTGQDLAASLHALRGSAENMGLRHLSIHCRKGETLIAKGEGMDTETVTAAFSDGMRALMAHMGLPDHTA